MRSTALIRIVPPATEPVTLAEAKLFLRIDHDTEDGLLASLIRAARAVAEEYLRRSLITQGWRLTAKPVTAHYLALPRGPVQAITQVALIARDGARDVLDPSLYALSAGKDTLLLEHSPDSSAVEIEFTCGYGGAGAVPEPIRQGITMHVASLYDGRAGGSLPDATKALYAPYREMRI